MTPENGEPLTQAPDDVRAEVERLVEHFRTNEQDLRRDSYKEARCQREFIEPFFEALGWDVRNTHRRSERYKDVVHEDTVEIAGQSKAPDYCFRVGGQPVFYVEAKKPSDPLKSDRKPAFQLRRYAWNAKLPVSILTDFEEFAVYDCRVRPRENDDAGVARIDYLGYRDYLEQLDSLYGRFSREGVERGGLDRYIGDVRKQRGTSEVDEELLKDIEAWREALAKDIARNNRLPPHELNEVVQATIDRMLFFRIAEDRRVEEPGRLRSLLSSTGVSPVDKTRGMGGSPMEMTGGMGGSPMQTTSCTGEPPVPQGGIYARLCDLYRLAEDKYNAGLFDFGPDGHAACLGLTVSDKVLKPIIDGLYFPKCPYEFSVIRADILGAVYEQFLGKVIRLTKSGMAKVEEKPEVKKAGGVYYTPTYIVDYIVEHTVGEAVKEAGTPAKVAKLRILDPACGSGSFLLGAYDWLLNWHRDYYAEHEPEKLTRRKDPPIVRFGGNDWRLSISERKRILLNNLYGVDIDEQAVEVTKLNLLLKCMEGDIWPGVVRQMKLLHDERVLPNIDANIKCGNSLIGWDYFEGKLVVNEEERRRVNPFNWEDEFKDIMAAGGFDCVIGNPPYIRIHNLVDYYPGEVRYVQAGYASAGFGKVDIYVAFIERGVGLLSPGGVLGFIVPNKFLQADYGVGLRRLLANEWGIRRLVDFQAAQVFGGATTYTSLLFVGRSPTTVFSAQFNTGNRSPQGVLADERVEEVTSDSLTEAPWVLAYSDEARVCAKVEAAGTPLGDVAQEMITGVKTGANAVFVLEGDDVGEARDGQYAKRFLKPYVKAEALKRYAVGGTRRALVYPYELRQGESCLVAAGVLQEKTPAIWERLKANRSTLEGRQKGDLKGPTWYGLSFASSMTMFEARKIVTATLAPRNSFALDTRGLYFPQGAGGGMGVVLEDHCLPYTLGLLNSGLLSFYFTRISSRFQGAWFAYEPRYVRRLPIRTIDFDDPKDVARHDRMVRLVERMLELHRDFPKGKGKRDRELIERQIAATDREIDQLVYELYGLTEEEIAIVEGTVGG